MGKISIIAVTIVFAGITLGPRPGSADVALAIGVAPGGVSHGWVWGAAWGDDASDAQTKALKTCQGILTENNAIPPNASKAQRACKIIGTYVNKCFAVASNGQRTVPATGMGWDIAPDSRTAATRAVAKCEATPGKVGPPCVIQGSHCDGSAK